MTEDVTAVAGESQLAPLNEAAQKALRDAAEQTVEQAIGTTFLIGLSALVDVLLEEAASATLPGFWGGVVVKWVNKIEATRRAVVG